MLVKDLMSTSVKTVSPDTSVAEVASLMCLYRYSGLPVVEGERLVGIIAEKDVLAELFPSVEDTMQNMASIDFDRMAGEYGNLLGLSVSDLMTSACMTVPPDMHLLQAAIIMAGRRFRRIPVAQDGKLVGMLSLGDVHKALFHQQFSKRSEAA